MKAYAERDGGEPFSRDDGFKLSLRLKYDNYIKKKERKRKFENLITNITFKNKLTKFHIEKINKYRVRVYDALFKSAQGGCLFAVG